jgi:tetratricopeptide (TPR) repeat protein
MTDNQDLYDQAVAAAKQKDFASARTLLKQLLKQEPDNVNAWLLGAHVVESPSDAIRCYERVLKLDPNHAYAKQKLSELKSGQPAVPGGPSHAGATVSPSRPVASQPKADPLKAVSRPQAPPPGPPAPKSRVSTWMIVLAGGLLGTLCLAVLAVAFFSLSGLQLGSAQPTPTNQQLFDVINENARAANAEDLAAYMATIHPNSSMYGQTEKALKDVFSQFDLDFKFYDLQVTGLESNEARVHFSLLTRKRAGPEFRNNIVIGTMILRPDNGIWKIYNQEVDDVQY